MIASLEGGAPHMAHMGVGSPSGTPVLDIQWRFRYEGRAEGDGPKVTELNLRFAAVFCENLRFQMLEFPEEGVNL